MKAITIYQPFALLVVVGLKRIETRPRATNIRGRVAIHAGKKDQDAVLKGWTEEARRAIERANHEEPMISFPQMRGAIIGTVELVDCLKVAEENKCFREAFISHSGVVEGGAARVNGLEYLCGDYTPGRFAWIFKDPVLFDQPVRMNGKQGWWNWDEMEV